MRKPKVAMTLLVRNEDDIIEDNILYHSAIGVDKFFVMDNLSTDMTATIIERLSGALDIKYFFQSNDEYRQSEWVSFLAQEAASDPAGFDWVINNDADEFWVLSDNISINDYLRNVPESVAGLILSRYNAVNIDKGQSNSKAYSSHPSFSEYFHVNSTNCIGGKLPPKCMHRARSNVIVPQGNHSVLNIDGKIQSVDDAFILHYPYRFLDHYKAKIRLGGAAYTRNSDLDESVGITWRKHYKIVETNKIIRFWRSLYRTYPQVRRGLCTNDYIHINQVTLKLKEIDSQTKMAQTQTAFSDLIEVSEDYWRSKRNSILTPLRNQPSRDTLAHHNLAFSLGGISAQVKNLRDFERQISEGKPLNESLNEIRDCFSLLPSNKSFFPFLARLFEIFSPNTVYYLRKKCFNKVVLLHISCNKYLDRSRRSSESFDALSSDYFRLIIIGDNSCHTPDTSRIDIENDSNVCRIPVSDDYECLGAKVFYALMVIHLIGKPSHVVKLDDDLKLDDLAVFHDFIQQTKASGHSYVGWKVGSKHANQWHGWHIGKCHDKNLEKKGFQYPVVTSYAAGGFGYILDQNLLASCTYMYLAMRSFFAQHIIQLEDVYIGHAAQMAGIKLCPIDIEKPIAINQAALPGIARKNW